jgi:PQQ-dependent catabolism-associated beta-propeller protein
VDISAVAGRSSRGIGRMLPAAAVLLMAACTGDAPDPGQALVIGYVGDTAHTDGWRGAQLGAMEAQRAAQLIGRELEVYLQQAADSGSAHGAAARMVEQGARVIVGGYDEPTCRTLARLADSASVIYLNVGCSSDTLRGGDGNSFHVQASDAQRRAAGGGGSIVRPEARVVWHGELGRYGAGQLNRRFFERFGASAGADAWSAWMAMKIAWEATQQLQSSATSALRAHLLSETAEFDGHKGQPLTFDPVTRQLRQPLFDAPSSSSAGGAIADPRTVSVEGAGALRAAVAAGARLAVVTNEGSSDVSIIDASVNAVIATIGLVARPRGVRISPDGTLAYVAVSDDAPTEETDADAIVAIDLARAEIVALHQVGSDPEQFALSPDGRRLYAANEDAGTATITDLATGTVLRTLVVGIEPEGVAISPDGRWIYITAETSNTVSVIDAQSDEVVANFLVEVRPRAAAFSADGRQAYISNEISGTLSIVAVPAHEVIATVELAGGAARPVSIAVAPDGSRVYVANGHANSISVVDPIAQREIALIAVGRRPWGVDVSRDGAVIYTANGGSGDVTVIDARTLRVIATIPVGERPWGVALTR